MGELLPYRDPRRLRRGQPLILLWLASVWASEVAIEGLGDQITVTVDGFPASHGNEARGLEAGTRTVMVYNAKGEKLAWHPVLLDESERVVLRGPMMAEVSRGPVPDRTEEEAGPDRSPQPFLVTVADRHITRVHVDGVPLPYELAQGGYRSELAAGPHEVQITIGGRRRHTQPLVVAGAPWRCGVDRDGSAQCVELDPSLPLEPPMDVGSTLELLQRTSPSKRMAAVTSVPGSLTCLGVAALLEAFVGDEERVEVARRLRPRVADPANYQAIVSTLSFPTSVDAVEALYRP